MSYGLVTYPRGGTFGPRRQDTIQLVFIHNGSARIYVDGEVRTIVAGFGTVLLPGAVEHFRFSAVTETTHSWIHFWSALDDTSLLERAATADDVFHVQPAVARLVQEILDRTALPYPVRTLRAYEVLYRILGEQSSEPTALDGALTFIEQHLGDDVDIEQLARAALVSRSRLFRLFRTGVGTTPATYMWERRVQLATELLQETGLPVAVIAERAGFKSPKHLARRVRAATGMSPVQVRATALGGVEPGTWS